MVDFKAVFSRFAEPYLTAHSASIPPSHRRAMLTGAAPGRGLYELFEVVPDGAGVDYWEGEE